MSISRRYFIKNGGLAMLGMAALPAFLQRAVAASTTPNKKKMVVLFQRGAMDGLNVVIPFGERNYYNLRPTIAIPAPRKRRHSHRFGRLLRVASKPRSAIADLSKTRTRDRPRSRLARSHPLAF